jgi:hypothetical protein
MQLEGGERRGLAARKDDQDSRDRDRDARELVPLRALSLEQPGAEQDEKRRRAVDEDCVHRGGGF